MAIVALEIDLAKNVFAVHGIDATGRVVLVRPNVARAKLLELPGWANTLIGDLLSEVGLYMTCYVSSSPRASVLSS